jgi:hypothetical protein
MKLTIFDKKTKLKKFIYINVKAFTTLLNSNPEVFKPCLPKTVECCVAYFASKDKDSDKEKVKRYQH